MARIFSWEQPDSARMLLGLCGIRPYEPQRIALVVGVMPQDEDPGILWSFDFRVNPRVDVPHLAFCSAVASIDREEVIVPGRPTGDIWIPQGRLVFDTDTCRSIVPKLMHWRGFALMTGTVYAGEEVAFSGFTLKSRTTPSVVNTTLLRTQEGLKYAQRFLESELRISV